MEKYVKCCPSADLRTSGGSAKELGLWVGVVLLISSRILPVNPSLTGAIAAGTWQGSLYKPRVLCLVVVLFTKHQYLVSISFAESLGKVPICLSLFVLKFLQFVSKA